MIHESEIDKKVQWLLDSCDQRAEARAHRIRLEHNRKAILANIMKEHLDKPVSAQTREAEADPRYQEYLDGLQVAIERDEKFMNRRAAVEEMIGVWRSQERTHRTMREVG